jgi:uncharacterized protein YneF (UPF0154 family)
LLGIVPLSFEQWIWIAGIAVSLLFAVEVGKWTSSRIRRSLTQPGRA